jgi:hypothetical protein
VQAVTDNTLNDDSDKKFSIGSVLKIKSPNGGETWEAGSSYEITWEKGNGGGYVRILLYSGSSHYATPTMKTKNDGSFDWVVPSSVVKGSDYKIRITSLSSTTVNDYSDDSFSINNSSYPSGDYQYLCTRNNCSYFGNRVRRWPSKTIPVSGATYQEWRSAANRWPTVGFNYVGSEPTQGIQIKGYSNSYPNACGWASWWYYSSGEMGVCEIRVNTNHDLMACGTEADTMTHEIGHCIGVFEHTSDGGIMDATAAGSSVITTPVRKMIGLLYSLSPGADISSHLSRNPAQQKQGRSNYVPNGRRLIFGGTLFTTQRSQ